MSRTTSRLRVRLRSSASNRLSSSSSEAASSPYEAATERACCMAGPGGPSTQASWLVSLKALSRSAGRSTSCALRMSLSTICLPERRPNVDDIAEASASCIVSPSASLPRRLGCSRALTGPAPRSPSALASSIRRGTFVRPSFRFGALLIAIIRARPDTPKPEMSSLSIPRCPMRTTPPRTPAASRLAQARLTASASASAPLSPTISVPIWVNCRQETSSSYRKTGPA